MFFMYVFDIKLIFVLTVVNVFMSVLLAPVELWRQFKITQQQNEK